MFTVKVKLQLNEMVAADAAADNNSIILRRPTFLK